MTPPYVGQDRREPVIECQKCRECDQICADHSAMLDFKEKSDKDISTVFDQLDKIVPELTRTTTYVKIGGAMAVALLVVLCVMTASSYMRLSEFIITHSASESEQSMERGKLSNEIEHLKERCDDIEEDVDSVQDDINTLEG